MNRVFLNDSMCPRGEYFLVISSFIWVVSKERFHGWKFVHKSVNDNLSWFIDIKNYWYIFTNVVLSRLILKTKIQFDSDQLTNISYVYLEWIKKNQEKRHMILNKLIILLGCLLFHCVGMKFRFWWCDRPHVFIWNGSSDFWKLAYYASFLYYHEIGCWTLVADKNHFDISYKKHYL